MLMCSLGRWSAVKEALSPRQEVLMALLLQQQVGRR
jgi:hypothetical protein